MTINYCELSEKYKPKKVKTLLVGEAPPLSEKKYFYLPDKMNPKRNIEYYRTLPATIFYNYLKEIPYSEQDYENLLFKLKENGIYLIDILDQPLRIRKYKLSEKEKNKKVEKNREILLEAIDNLRDKIKDRKINVDDENIIFLLPRLDFKKCLKNKFPKSNYIRWIDFRLKRSTIL